MRVAIYPAALHVCGGGEKYIGKIAEVLSRESEVSFLVFEQPDFGKLQSRLNIDLSRVKSHAMRRPILLRLARQVHLGRLVEFCDAWVVSKCTREYDLFINQGRMPLARSLSGRSLLVCEVPPIRARLKDKPFARFGLDLKGESYETVVVNSYFTKRWADRYYGKESVVLYPPVDTNSFTPSAKERVILSVGRFSEALHCKKQLEMIKTFKRLCADTRLQGWEYHLAGGLTSSRYLRKCQEEASGCPIVFHVDASFGTLRDLYGKARIFWHATGLGEDETRHPERMEHFGITTVEAMSAGCVPVVINRGGQPEIVQDGVNGFLFDTLEDLEKKTLSIIDDEATHRKMSVACVERSRDFGLDKFERRVQELFAV